jgi:dipeptidyl aminopeptidase/acylaminoacyl peptidase
MKPIKTPLISRRALFSNPDHASVQVSPDGAYIAWLAPRDGVLNVWVAPREDLLTARPVTQDRGRGVRFFLWAHSGVHLLYLQDKNGDENWRLFTVDLRSGDIKDLTPFEGAQARVISVSHEFPEEIIIGVNNRNPQWHDIYRLNIVTGERTLLVQNDRFISVIVDNDYRLRIATQMNTDGGLSIYVPSDLDWQLWETILAEDSLTTSPIGFDKANRVIFMTDSRGRNTSALVAVDPETKIVHLIAEDSKANVEDVMRHPMEKNIQAVSFVYDRKYWKIIDQTIEPDLGYLRTGVDGDLEVVSRTYDDKFWVVLYLVDNGPARYYLYDREQRVARFLFTNRQALEDQPLVKMQT